MHTTVAESPARATAERINRLLKVEVGGRWQITNPAPEWKQLVRESEGISEIKFQEAGLEAWDSSLVLFLHGALRWARDAKVAIDISAMPEGLQHIALHKEGKKGAENIGPAQCAPRLFEAVGLLTGEFIEEYRQIAKFVGECTISASYLIKHPREFRWRDCLAEMQQCGAMALPIVGLISFLVGLIMAYQSAILLRTYGGDIYVADFVGLVVVREMGAIMAAIVLAGRTGAAFAATLGTMEVGEGIDALQTLRLAPV